MSDCCLQARSECGVRTAPSAEDRLKRKLEGRIRRLQINQKKSHEEEETGLPIGVLPEPNANVWQKSSFTTFAVESMQCFVGKTCPNVLFHRAKLLCIGCIMSHACHATLLVVLYVFPRSTRVAILFSSFVKANCLSALWC